jgi:hypothetical protein
MNQRPVRPFSPSNDPPQAEFRSVPPECLSLYLKLNQLIRARKYRAAYEIADLIDLNFSAAEKFNL